MTRPKRPATTKRPGQKSTGTKTKSPASGSAASGSASSGTRSKSSTTSRPRGPQKSSAKGRDGKTREATRIAREPGAPRPDDTREGGSAAGEGSTRRYGSAVRTTTRKTSSRTGSAGTGRAAPPRIEKKRTLPELRRVQLQAPPPETEFTDRDGQKIAFPDSNLKRVAAQILTEKRKSWRYRPFSFPLFTDKGNEQTFNFDFYIYDVEDSVIRLILVVASESREVWDKIGRFKRQYPMYTYELWTPEKLHQYSGPRGKLGW